MRKTKGMGLIVVASDIHAGSTAAVFPPEMRLAEGPLVSASALQLWFWECWLRTIAWVGAIAGKDPFALVLNGDLIEGDHHRTDQIIGRNIGDHVDAAKLILAPLVGMAEKLFITRGTECHVGDAEAGIAEHFGAERNPDTGRRVFDRLTLDVRGVRMVARHHVSTTSRPWLECNGLGMELASEQLSAVRNGEPMPRILCVAHRHIADDVKTTEGICVATPAWQGLTRHGYKVVPAARCRPGIYILDFRGVAHGELPHIHRKLFQAPHAKAVQL